MTQEFILNEEVYNLLVDYEQAYKTSVVIKEKLDSLRRKDMSLPYENEPTASLLKFTIGDKIEMLENELINTIKTLSDRQSKAQSGLDLQFFIELRSPRYRPFMYNYYVYAFKENNGPLIFISENSETGGDKRYDSKEELIFDFVEMYHYLHKDLSRDEMIDFVSDRFKYV
ncbi:hypothetical protein ACOMCU_15770 [Lysinibacillus sp. UGB7]|uniref:hypothetical protein n=1 Tax=Lysinibacillus sp. UGB7 TaxID=3411039 RepID=UPI003B7D9FBD